jgi:hypothetical protein
MTLTSTSTGALPLNLFGNPALSATTEAVGLRIPDILAESQCNVAHAVAYNIHLSEAA